MKNAVNNNVESASEELKRARFEKQRVETSSIETTWTHGHHSMGNQVTSSFEPNIDAKLQKTATRQ